MRLRIKLKNSNTARFVLLIVSLLLALFIGEAVIRAFRLAPPVQALWVDDNQAIYIRSTNAILGHVLRPDFSQAHPNGRATVNSHGLRDRERSIAKPPGTRRILVLGDSVVEGVTYVPDDKTLTRQWEALYSDGKTEVLNLGISGYCTRAEIELLERVGLQFQPDIVVVVFVINDFHNFNLEHTANGGVIDRPEWSKHLFVGSCLFRFLSLRFNWYEFATESDPLRWNHAAIGRNNVTDGLARLRELANRLNFKVLITAWPEFQNTEIVDKREVPESPHQLVVERLAKMNGLPVTRLSDGFRKHYATLKEETNARLHYTSDGDTMHPNVEGSRIAADLLKQAVESGIPSPPYRLRLEDVPAVRAAQSWGDNHTVRPQSMIQRQVSAFMRQGRIPDAETFLKEILKENPDQLTANIAMGGLLVDAKRPGEAIPYMQRVVGLQPDIPDFWVALAIGHVGATNQTAALKVLSDGLERHPGSANLHFNYGYILSAGEDLDKAREHLRRAVEIDPTFPNAQLVLEAIEQALAKRKE